MRIVDKKLVISIFITLFVLAVFLAFGRSFASILVPEIKSFAPNPVEKNSLKVTFKNNNKGTLYTLELLNTTTGKTNILSGAAQYFTYQNLTEGKQYEVIIRACTSKSNLYTCSLWSSPKKATTSSSNKSVTNKSTTSNQGSQKTYQIIYNSNGGKGSMPKQTVRVSSLSNLKASAFTKEDYIFMGWATKENSQVVDMNHFQIGKVSYRDGQGIKDLVPSGSITLYAVWRGNGALAACDWAKLIAADNTFTYGLPEKKGGHASHMGCYFCDKNKIKTKLGGDAYLKTYVCNSYVNAAFVHGANDPNMSCVKDYVNGLNARLSGSSDYDKDKTINNGQTFIYLGHPVMSKLRPGDVLEKKNTHTMLYVGNGLVAEATSKDPWGESSISLKKLTVSTYKDYKVLRYLGH